MPPESKLIESTDNLESTVSSLTQKLDEFESLLRWALEKDESKLVQELHNLRRSIDNMS